MDTDAHGSPAISLEPVDLRLQDGVAGLDRIGRVSRDQLTDVVELGIENGLLRGLGPDGDEETDNVPLVVGERLPLDRWPRVIAEDGPAAPGVSPDPLP